MIRKLPVLLLIGALLMPAVIHAQETPAPQPLSDGVALTIYNQGTALVQDRRTFNIGEGVSVLDFTDVASTIDATSITFRSLTDPVGTFVLEQNYVYDLVGSEALLARYVDQEIRLTLNDGTEVVGTLLSGRSGSVIVQIPRDSSVQLIDFASIRDVRFPRLPDGLITRPTLRWTLQSPARGDQQVELTYLADGLNWTADYNLLLSADSTALDLNGWVTLTNGSGTTYSDALVKLVAGDVNRLPQPVPAMAMDGMIVNAFAEEAARGATQREFFEYQLYEINRRVTVASNETKQVEFVTSAGVPANTFYVYDGGAPFYGYGSPYMDTGYNDFGITDVQTYLEFTTDAENGLGADLPAGRVRVYQQDVDGAALLIGENFIDHTPEGEDISIYLGNAFDLVGERTRTDFRYLSDKVFEETFQIKLRNRKDTQTVEIRVPERMFRWSNWEILNNSDPFEKVDASSIEFRVMVEPGQEKIITYTVRYTFP